MSEDLPGRKLGFGRLAPFGREIGFGVPGRPHWSDGRGLVQLPIGSATITGQACEAHIVFVARDRQHIVAFMTSL